MTGMFAKVSLCVLTSALCCGGMGLYGQSALPVDEGTLLKQELELAKMERENLELRRELLKAQESAQRGEAAVAHIAELKRQMRQRSSVISRQSRLLRSHAPRNVWPRPLWRLKSFN